MHRSKSAALFDNLVCAALLDRQAARLGAKPSHSTDYGFLLHDDQARPIHIEEILGILHCCSHLRGL